MCVTRRDWLPTKSQDSRPQNRVLAAKGQSSGKNWFDTIVTECKMTQFRHVKAHFNHCLTVTLISNNLRAFHRLGQHYDDSNSLLPDHSPEVDDRVPQTALGCYVPYVTDVMQLKNTINTVSSLVNSGCIHNQKSNLSDQSKLKAPHSWSNPDLLGHIWEKSDFTDRFL